MTVLARIAPNRVSQRMSFLIVDPFAVGGLAMVRSFRELGVAAEVSTSVSHGIALAHRNKHSVVIIRDADSFSTAEVGLFSKLASTRTCFVLASRESAMAKAVRDGQVQAKVVPPNLDTVDLLGAVRWALRTAKPSAKKKAPPVHATAASGPVAGEFDIDVKADPRSPGAEQVRITHCVMRPVRRRTQRFIPAVSYKYRREVVNN
jgi:hypothetical protein